MAVGRVGSILSRYSRPAAKRARLLYAYPLRDGSRRSHTLRVYDSACALGRCIVKTVGHRCTHTSHRINRVHVSWQALGLFFCSFCSHYQDLEVRDIS